MLLLFSISWGTASAWWVPVCLLLGAAYAWLMYRSPVSLEPRMRNGLAVLRAVVVAVIAFLLLSPLVKSVNYQPQKPLVLVVQDNSSSVQMFRPAGFDAKGMIDKLSSLKQQLGDDYDVREFNFGQNIANGLNPHFDGRQTDIGHALHQLNERFVNQNIGAVVLATDGLYNQGADPQYEAIKLKSTIYTVALGDTVPRRDLLIGNINYNKTALLGNDLILEVLAEAYQSNGQPLRLSVTQDGRQIYSQPVMVNSDSYRKTIPIKLNADKKGIRKFTVNIAPVANEVSKENNAETIYIEVLDARQKLLLLYNSPHPDISAIKQSVERNRNFEIKALQVADLTTVKPADYSLVMLYQVNPVVVPQLNSFSARSKTPIWYFLGAQSDVSGTNGAQKLLQINTSRTDMQEVFAETVKDFSAFTLTDSTKSKLAQLPPLLAPFGNYGAPASTQVLLKQKIGSVSTSYPLLLFGDDAGRRTAVLAGEGLWRWQLAEYQDYGSHAALEELLGQSVQYLTANAAKQRFRAYPSKNVFDEDENVLLNAELYNEALELVNTPDVKISLKNTSGKIFSYLFSRSGQNYQLNAGTLPKGEYSYVATTALGKQQFTSSGQLTIKPLNLESRQSTANHGLLRGMARQSGGEMVAPAQVGKLAELIKKNENIKTVVYEDKRYSSLIDVKWVFMIILIMLSAEWFLRKREGEV